LQNINDNIFLTDADYIALPPRLHAVFIGVNTFVRIGSTYGEQLRRDIIIVLLLLCCSAVRCSVGVHSNGVAFKEHFTEWNARRCNLI
jgi:hypothetical protein